MTITKKINKLMEYGVPASVIYRELDINERTFSNRLASGKGFKRAQMVLFELRWGEIFKTSAINSENKVE